MSDLVFVQSLADVTERKLPFTFQEVAQGIRAPRGSLAREFWDLIAGYSDGLTDPITKKPLPPIQVAARRLVVARDIEMRAACDFFELRDAIDNLRDGKEVARGLDINDLCSRLEHAEQELFVQREIRGQHERAWDSAREDRLRRLVAAIGVHVEMQQNLIRGSVEKGWQPSPELVGAVAEEVAELRKRHKPVSDWFKAMSFCSSITKRPYFSLKELPDMQTVRHDPSHRSPLGRDVVQRFSDLVVR